MNLWHDDGQQAEAPASKVQIDGTPHFTLFDHVHTYL
jgi:hypothetical protein